MVLAFLSALFAALTSVLAKIGIERIDSDLATAVRTTVVLLMSWVIVLVVGSAGQVRSISLHSLVFLVLSGLSTGASWICFFKALQLGNVNKVVPIDKSSTVLTMAIAFIFLGEGFTVFSAAGAVMIFAGTMLMIERKDVDDAGADHRAWIVYAVLSAVFASLTSILGKVGIEDVESNLGTAVRTVVVFVLAWLVHSMKHSDAGSSEFTRRNLSFLVLSGIATGASWLCFYGALQSGPASIVVPIDKLSVLFTVLFAVLILRERMSVRSWSGLFLLVAGTLVLLA